VDAIELTGALQTQSTPLAETGPPAGAACS
jgi:hypothetical protein